MTAYDVVMTAFLAASVAHFVLLDAASILRVVRKAKLAALGVLHMVLGRDKRWAKRRGVDARTVAAAETVATKRLIFVRHGESEWNLVFNRGPKALLPFKLLVAVAREVKMLVFGDEGSVLFDSPLTTEGLEQAQGLAALLRDPASRAADASLGDLAVLRGDATAPMTSCLASSNLRRALQTCVVAFQDRVACGGAREDVVHVLSSLQEVSTNVDALALAGPFAAPRLPRVPAELQAPEIFAVGGNAGNKPVFATGGDRLYAFAAFALRRPEDCVVVAGHSLWFRSFFDEFLPCDVPHVAKARKIRNGGAVALDLTYARLPGPGGGAHVLSVAPESVVPVHLGFDDDAPRLRRQPDLPEPRPPRAVPPHNTVVLSPLKPSLRRRHASPPRRAARSPPPRR